MLKQVAYNAILRDTNLPWQKILNKGKKYCFKKGSVMSFIHDKKPCLFYIIQGIAIQVFKTVYDEKRTIDMYGQNILIGEPQSIAQDEYWQSEAFTSIEGVFFPLEYIFSEDFICNNTELIINFQESQTLKMTRSFHHAASLTLNNAQRNLSRLIIAFSFENNNADIFNLGISQEECASLIGIHRESFINLLRKFKQEGIFSKFTKSEIIISNRELLKQYAQLPDNIF